MYPPMEKPSAPASSSYPPTAPPPEHHAYPPSEKPTTYSNPPSPGPRVVEGIPVSPMSNAHPLHIQAPPSLSPSGAGYWSTGLCDCFSDIKSCCLVCWCPCVAFGQLSEIVDKGTSSCCCNGSLYLLLCSLGALGSIFGVPVTCQWIYSCTYRGKIKSELGMPPSCCEECCIHFWCEPCALCQEYREIQKKGYDLSLGWNGNTERQRLNGSPTPVGAPVGSPAPVGAPTPVGAPVAELAPFGAPVGAPVGPPVPPSMVR